MIQAVLFDLDGTLLDTSEGIIESVRFTIEELGYPSLIENTILRFVGPPIQNSLIKFLRLSPKEAQHGADIFRDYYKSKALFKATLYPGIYDLLNSLKIKGVKIGVATYKREDYALSLLEHFKIADLCDVIHGADNNNKLTKANIIELCLNELNVDKANIVLVGDTEHDAKGAKEAGIKFIAVGWGFGYKLITDVSEYPFIKFANSPGEILSIF